MIQVIDKISYMSKSSKDSFIDTNEFLNMAYKRVVEDIKTKMKKINSNGKSATVTITGKVIQKDTVIDIKITNCTDEDFLETIQTALNK